MTKTCEFHEIDICSTSSRIFMPTVEPSGNTKVLVSGANGYIGMWVVRTLLEQGYTVRGAVRSAEKGKRLRDHFHSYGDKVELTVVEEDITKVRFDSLLTRPVLTYICVRKVHSTKQ